ncbi:FAD binding domain-containing protein [Paenibacillus piri]|uniref:Molybdopterin dehydrogenase n=1 Tax=Paenibacillus piri TaxID=2547395 RepID=A0A4V6PIL3_9BACL|nr:FAD binding domain-containing protein [Paenibacillus piri]TDG00545.1 molybdopterin dehydrogenase [Paenibacillus piri]
MAAGLYPNPEFQSYVWQPRTLSEAWQLKQRLAEQAVFVAGGTLLRTHWESGTAAMPPHLVSLQFLPELRRIQSDRGHIRIGSAAALSACQRDPEVPELLKAACRQIAAPSIRNVGTIGGNIMSAVGDTLPALLAADARLAWFDGQGTILQSAADWLAQRRLHNAFIEQRLLVEVVIPEETETEFQFYEKLGRRETFCPSVAIVAGAFRSDPDGKLLHIRLAAGSAAASAIRLTGAEALLQGQRLSLRLIQSVHAWIIEHWDGGADAFASNAYRRQAAANLIAAALWSRIPGGSR